jgi:nitrogen fixation protein FixH
LDTQKVGIYMNLKILIFFALFISLVVIIPTSTASSDYGDLKVNTPSNCSNDFNKLIIEETNLKTSINNSSINKSKTKTQKIENISTKRTKNKSENVEGHTPAYVYVEEWRLGWHTVGPEYWWTYFPGQEPMEHYGYHNVYGWYFWCGWKWV